MKEKMLAVMKATPAPGATIAETTVPKPGKGEVLVKVRAASICGTDIHIYDWDEGMSKRVKPPMIFGHEMCGEILELGEGVRSGVKPGDLVSAETHIACGHCFQCRTGNKHICENVKILGIDTNGCYAEYAVIPAENAWVNDASLPPEVATAQEPLGNAVHVLLTESVEGKSVAIFGCGPIGLCAVQLAKNLGASAVYAVDVKPYRLEMAKKMGANLVVNARESDAVSEIIHANGGRKVDVFVEVSGNPQAFQQGFKALRAGGRASILGVFAKPVEIDVTNDIVFKAARVYGVNGRKMFETWFQAREFLRKGFVDLRKIITHKFPLAEFDKAMQLMKSGDCGKIVLTPPQ